MSNTTKNNRTEIKTLLVVCVSVPDTVKNVLKIKRMGKWYMVEHTVIHYNNTGNKTYIIGSENTYVKAKHRLMLTYDVLADKCEAIISSMIGDN